LSTLWCEGKARSGTRPLTDEEAAWTRRKRQLALVRVAAGASCIVLPFAIAIVLFVVGHPLGPRRPRFDQAANIALILWTFVSLPAGILVVRDAIRHRTRLFRDLADGSVWDFAHVSVLPVSRVLIAPNERRGQVANVAAAAPWPASFHPVPFEVRHEETGEQRKGMQRRLSEDEGRELATHAQARLWSWWLVWPAIIGTGWIVAAMRGQRPALGALGVVGFAWIAFRLWRIARIREALRRDSASGVVVVVPGIAEEPEHEFLPESGMVWTMAGAPTEWRLLPLDPDEKS
jgi:hypothetical protein